MDEEIINGVMFFALPPINTTGGRVLHAIKGFDENFLEFGECYFSTAENSMPKAWKKHSLMICNLFIPYGTAKFVFYDDRKSSKDYGKVAEFTLSEANYGRLVIHPGVWFGFVGIGDKRETIILNVASTKHDSSESLRLEPETTKIPYRWKID
jgi:dTDP-4-dehydrorhamnose 3,5-epimerase-like enzyme